MEVLERLFGFEICRTSAGHLVMANPLEPPEERALAVRLLIQADALDALFFDSIDEARLAVREMTGLDKAA